MNLPQGFSIVPFADQPRSAFSCGIPALDVYLRQQAGQDARRKAAAPFVLLDPTGVVAGYYTLSAFGVNAVDLPDDLARKLSKYSMLPTTLLGRLAISRGHQGVRLGGVLLIDALQRSLRNTSEIASIGVIAEAYNIQAKEFYLRYGFIPMKDRPNSLFIPMKTIEQSFK